MPLPAPEMTLLSSCHHILSDPLSPQCFLPFVLLSLFTCFGISSNPTFSRSPSRSPGWNPSLLLPLWMLKAPTAFWTEICMDLWKLASTLWSVACQALTSLRFPRQEHWGELPFLSPGDLRDPGIELVSLALAGGFFTAESHLGSPHTPHTLLQKQELCSVLWGSLDGKGVWGRVDTCTYVWLSRSAMYPTLDNIFNRLYILQYKINHFKKQQQQGSLSYTFITHSTRVFFKRWATYEFDHEPCKTLASAVPIHTHLPLSPPQPLEAIKPGLCALVFAALVAFTVPVSWPHVYLVVSCFRIN